MGKIFKAIGTIISATVSLPLLILWLLIIIMLFVIHWINDIIDRLIPHSSIKVATGIVRYSIYIGIYTSMAMMEQEIKRPTETKTKVSPNQEQGIKTFMEALERRENNG